MTGPNPSYKKNYKNIFLISVFSRIFVVESYLFHYVYTHSIKVVESSFFFYQIYYWSDMSSEDFGKEFTGAIIPHEQSNNDTNIPAVVQP